jgi:glycine/D-amino acid oxidase-like deaminating enzyme
MQRYLFMNLRTPESYWLLKSGLLNVYPSLQEDLKVGFAIMGGGITGALVAYYLAQAGLKVAVFDRRHIGMGSTCASTGLLQYEIDKPLFELAGMIGEKQAARSYHLCLESIAKLGELCGKLKIEAEFEYKKSFYYASPQARHRSRTAGKVRDRADISVSRFRGVAFRRRRASERLSFSARPVTSQYQKWSAGLRSNGDHRY